MRRDLAGLSFAEFAAWSRGLAGHEDRCHRALYRQVMTHGSFAPAELPEWRAAPPAAVARLTGAAAAEQMPTVVAQRGAAAEALGDGVSEAVSGEEGDAGTGTDPAQVDLPVPVRSAAACKLLVRLEDGGEAEAVLIPMRGGLHHTVCVSSQIGCRMGCSFCHTARMGLVRSLAAHEIVGQAIAAGVAGGVAIRNVVFMGMGEPLDNADEVARAVRALVDGNGLGLSHRHITVSTVGRVDGLARWVELGLERVNLAVSLTAADDRLRSELMPVNRAAPLAELKRALLAIPIARDRRMLVSCVLIPGVTDGADDVLRLARWLDGLPALVNLIPYNPIPSRDWRAPTAAEVAAFRGRLEAAGVAVRVRTTRGDAVMAACGQLGDPARRGRGEGEAH